MWGRGPRGSNGTCSTLCRISFTLSATHIQIGPFWCCFASGWVCVHSGTLWVSPRNSPVRLRVSPASASTLTGVFNQWFKVLFPQAGTVGGAVYCVVHQLLPCWPVTALPTPLHNPSPRWVCQLPPCHESSPPSCLSSPLLPVWMNVSSLSPWLSEFYSLIL